MRAVNPNNQPFVDRFLIQHNFFQELVRGGRGHSLQATGVFQRAIQAWEILTDTEKANLRDLPEVGSTYDVEVFDHSKPPILDPFKDF